MQKLEQNSDSDRKKDIMWKYLVFSIY